MSQVNNIISFTIAYIQVNKNIAYLTLNKDVPQRAALHFSAMGAGHLHYFVCCHLCGRGRRESCSALRDPKQQAQEDYCQHLSHQPLRLRHSHECLLLLISVPGYI